MVGFPPGFVGAAVALQILGGSLLYQTFICGPPLNIDALCGFRNFARLRKIHEQRERDA